MHIRFEPNRTPWNRYKWSTMHIWLFVFFFCCCTRRSFVLKTSPTHKFTQLLHSILKCFKCSRTFECSIAMTNRIKMLILQMHGMSNMDSAFWHSTFGTLYLAFILTIFPFPELHTKSFEIPLHTYIYIPCCPSSAAPFIVLFSILFNSQMYSIVLI